MPTIFEILCIFNFICDFLNFVKWILFPTSCLINYCLIQFWILWGFLMRFSAFFRIQLPLFNILNRNSASNFHTNIPNFVLQRFLIFFRKNPIFQFNYVFFLFCRAKRQEKCRWFTSMGNNNSLIFSTNIWFVII